MPAFQLLGPLEVRDVNGCRAAIPRRKQRALLALLLLRSGATVSIDEIVDSLWGERPPASVRANLHSYVSSLRQLLARTAPTAAPRPVRTRNGYRMELDAGECDADLFEELASAGRKAVADGDYERATERLARALRLWRGPVLDDLPAYEWAMPHVARLDEVRVAAIEDRADARLHLGQHADLIVELAAATAENPLRERLWLQYMEALRRSGDRSRALTVYDRYRDMLDEELGVAPGPEIRELHHRLQVDPGEYDGPPAFVAASAETAATRPATRLPALLPALLPAAVADFTGRDDEVRRLRAMLAPGGVDDPGGPDDRGARVGLTVAGITGMAGVGKTALAVHVAHASAPAFPDGQLFVNLRGTDPAPLDPADVLGRFLRALGVPGPAVPTCPAERVELYRTVLAGRRVLVVLDNAGSEEQARPLLPGAATCAVLITSRSRLVGIEGAHWTGLDPFTDDEGRRMLTRVIDDDRASDPQSATRIVRLCGGLPLAVRIAAARLTARADWTLANLATLLGDEGRRLDLLRTGDLEVRASLAPSYHALPAPTRRLFRMLGQLDAPDFPEWIATIILGGPREVAARCLEDLVDAHLITVIGVDDAGQIRYRLHELVRLFARDRAAAEDPRSDVEATLRRVFTACGTTDA